MSDEKKADIPTLTCPKCKNTDVSTLKYHYNIPAVADCIEVAEKKDSVDFLVLLTASEYEHDDDMDIDEGGTLSCPCGRHFPVPFGVNVYMKGP
jgi:uncharacterized protein YbaR (Trm112 family)